MFLHSGQQGQPPLGQQRQHRTAQHQCDRILDRPEQSAPPVRIGRVAQKQAPILEQRFGEQEAQAQGRPPAAALPARAPTGASGAGSGPPSPSSAPGRRRERTQKTGPDREHLHSGRCNSPRRSPLHRRRPKSSLGGALFPARPPGADSRPAPGRARGYRHPPAGQRQAALPGGRLPQKISAF